MKKMGRKRKNKKDFPATVTVLTEALKDFAFDMVDTLDAFLSSACSSTTMARKLKLSSREYHSALQSLEKSRYIKKVNEDQFLITPKAIKKIRMIVFENADWETGKWDGYWRIIVFDIPEKRKRERNILRSFIKRKGFIGIQNSVFISPYADFRQLALLRSDLRIEKYVSFFISKSAETDDDMALRRRFKLA